MLKRSRRNGKNTRKDWIKKDCNELDCSNGVVSHPESNILECEVKWALESTVVNKLVDAMKFQQNYSDP